MAGAAIVATLREKDPTEIYSHELDEAADQLDRALELLRKCLASGCIAHGYKDREPSRCLGDEIIEFLEKVGK